MLVGPDDLGGGATLATATSADGVQDSDDGQDGNGQAAEYGNLTQADFEAIVDTRMARLEQRIDALYRGVQSMTDRTAATTANEIASLRAELNDLGEYAKATVDPDTLAEIQQRQKEARAALREKTLDAREATLNAQQQPRRDQPEPQPALAQTEWDTEFQGKIVPRLERVAKRQGVDLAAVLDALPSNFPLLPNGQPDRVAYLDAAETAIENAAERQRRAERPRPNVDTTVPAGAVGGSNQDFVDRYGAGRDGGIEPTRENAERYRKLTQEQKLVPRPLRR